MILLCELYWGDKKTRPGRVHGGNHCSPLSKNCPVSNDRNGLRHEPDLLGQTLFDSVFWSNAMEISTPGAILSCNDFRRERDLARGEGLKHQQSFSYYSDANLVVEVLHNAL